MAGNTSNYKLLLDAQIKSNSIEAQLKALSNKSTFLLKVRLDETDFKKFEAELEKIKAKSSSIGKITLFGDTKGGLAKATVEYKDQIGNVVQEYIKINDKVAITQKYTKDLAKDQAQIVKLSDQAAKATAKQADEMSRASINADKFLAKAKNMAQTPNVAAAVSTAQQIKVAVSEGDLAKVRELNNQLAIQKSALQAGRTGLDSWATGMRNAVKQTIEYSLSIGLVYGALRQLKEGIQFVADLNKELVKIQVLQVEGASTNQQIGDLAVKYNDLAQELGSTTIEITKGSVEWLRQGKTIEETQELLRSTMMLSKLGALESAQATEYLTAIINGFNMEATEAEDIVSKLVSIDNIAATSAGEMATAMQYSSAVANESGVSFERLAAMIGAVSSNTRLSAEMIGTAFRTMFVRMQQVKAGAIDETGMGLNNVEKVLANVNIALRDSTESFRPLEDVIEDVAKKWNTLSEVQRAQISNAIAGQRQAQIFSSVMQNYGDVEKYVTAQTESAGLAADRYSIYLKGVEASQNRLKTSWEDMAMSSVTSDMISDFYNLAATILDVLAAMGGIPTLLKVIIPLWILFNAELVKTNLLSIGSSIGALGTALRSLLPVMGSATVASNGLTGSLVAANVAALPFILTIGAITAAFVYGIKVINDYRDAQEKIRVGLETTTDSIIQEASSYDEYVKKTKEAAEAAGYFFDESGKMFHEGYHGAKVYVQGMDLISEAMWNANDSVDENERKIDTWTRTAGDAGEAASGFGGEIVTLSDTMKGLTEMVDSATGLLAKADIGEFNFESLDELAQIYPDYLNALTIENGQLKLNTDMVREYIASKAEQAVADAIAREATDEEIAILRAYAETLNQAQTVMINGTQMATGAFNEMAWSIANNAAISGNSFVDLQNKALTSTQSIYEFLTSGDEAFNSFIQQAAIATGRTIQEITNMIQSMVGQTYNDIAALNIAAGTLNGFSYATNDLQYQNQSAPPIFSPAPIGQQYPGGLADGESEAEKREKEKERKKAERERKKQERQRELQAEIDKAQREAEDSLKRQLKAYKDIIDARKDLLDSMKEERSYQQDVEDQNKNILQIQNELAALQFDDSEEAKARRLELQDQLGDAQQELENTQYDHSIELQKDKLDAQFEKYEKRINQMMEAVQNIDATSMEDFTQQLAEILAGVSEGGKASSGTHQTPTQSSAGTGSFSRSSFHDGGLVGGGTSLKSNEIFAKLLKGEMVVTPQQMDRFMTTTMPQIAETTNNIKGGGIEINMPIQVSGNLDKTSLPDIEKIVNKVVSKINDAVMSRGTNRRADLFAI